MKKLRAVSTSSGLAASIGKTTTLSILALGLGAGFWLASLPLVQAAATLTPAEMIQSKLPPNKTIATASEPQLLDAVCKAIRQWPKDTALIVRTATGARKNLRGDVLCRAVHCSPEKNSFTCTWVSEVVHEWIKADPSEANNISELTLRCAPDCRDALEGDTPGEGPNSPGNLNAGFGVGGGPGGGTCTVCHNNQPIQVSCSDVDSYLRSHPGDTAGACVATPDKNQ